MTRDGVQDKLLFELEVFKFMLRDRSLYEKSSSSRLVLLFV